MRLRTGKIATTLTRRAESQRRRGPCARRAESRRMKAPSARRSQRCGPAIGSAQSVGLTCLPGDTLARNAALVGLTTLAPLKESIQKFCTRSWTDWRAWKSGTIWRAPQGGFAPRYEEKDEDRPGEKDTHRLQNTVSGEKDEGPQQSMA